MSRRRRAAKRQQATGVVVDLDAIQARLVRPQSDFDGWCVEQDRQWDLVVEETR